MNALIVYASMTGNTAEAADVIAETLEDNDVEVDVVEAFDAAGEDFLDYDLCLIGTYTYGSHIPDDLVDLYEDLATIDLSGKVFATFGSGDHDYEHYCQSVFDFDQRLAGAGATRGSDPVTVELEVTKEDIAPLEALATHCVEHAQA
ncbi:MAG: flavodoxin [Aerococcus sp.]|nr:flavodoxin [Aerococcus sp.]